MATTKNTADLLAQAASTLPDNTTQQISPKDHREMDENIAQSSYNKITDSGLVGLKEYSILPTYESGQGCIVSGKVYISNKITGPGAFASGDWDLYDELTAAEKTKLGYLTVTAGADLDQMQTDIAALDGARINKGTFDQSLGVFPGGGTAQDGWTWIAVGVSTTIDGLEINPNDAIVAIVDNASTATASDWHLQDNTDKVISVNGSAGVVVLTKTDIGLSNVPNTDFTTAVGLNTAKVSNVSTNLSEGTSTTTSVDVNSSDGTNATLAAASTLRAGVMSSAKFDEVVLNTAKNSNVTHTSEVIGSEALTVQPIAVSNKPLITASGTMELLVNDAGVLKKVVASDFLGGDNIYTADGTLTASRTVTMGGNALNLSGGQTTIKGGGADALTTAFLVENSSGVDSFKIDNASNLWLYGNTGIGFGFSGAAGSPATARLQVRGVDQSDSVIAFRVEDSTRAGLFTINNAGGILALGNLGLGFVSGTSPTAKLNIRSAASSYNLWCENDSQVQLLRLHNDGNLWLNGNTGIGFGTSGSAAAAAVARLQVRGSDQLTGTKGFMVEDSTRVSLFEVRNDGALYTKGVAGFTGTGAYTNFTISNGIITAAS